MTRLIAHRGASGWAPEHTESAVRLAAQLGADAVEPDVVATRDGVLIVRHDAELSDTTDISERKEFADRRTTRDIGGLEVEGWFAYDFDWAEIATLTARERLPHLRPLSALRDGRDGVLRLTDLLEIADQTGLDVVVELKHGKYHADRGLPLDALLADALAGTHWQNGGRLTLESFEESTLHACRARGIDARLVYLIDAVGTAGDLPQGPTYAQQLSDRGLAELAERVDAISVSKTLLFERDAEARIRPSDLAARAGEAGLGLLTWTLRPENASLEPEHRLGDNAAAWGDWFAEWRMLAQLGLEAVFCDHPDLWRRLEAAVEHP